MKKSPAIGKVGKVFGPDGQLTVTLYDTFSGSIDMGKPVYVEIDKLPVPLFFESFTRRGRSGALVRFSDIDNQTRAAELTGKELFLPDSPKADRQSATTDENEILPEHLTGYRAVIEELANPDLSSENSAQDPESRVIEGKITAYIDNEMNPLFEIESEGQTLYIPAVDEFITGIDTDSREVDFTVPSGLLDLYL